jgi:predicted nuclease of predicted toxin-antitoxin system
MIVADENIDHSLIDAIRELGIDVYSINESNGGIRDEQVIELSRNPPRIILTEDKDFGEWVFAHHVRGISVLFLRYHFKDTAIMKSILVSLLSERIHMLVGYFTTVTTQKIRTRPIDS